MDGVISIIWPQLPRFAAARTAPRRRTGAPTLDLFAKKRFRARALPRRAAIARLCGLPSVQEKKHARLL
jgi:hypothetical protein